MESITDALVDAGYFRARISTLSDFDKIIGGMAWAMQVFSCDIDVDIFYTDSLDLGQKIALTERLVMVLLVMNCPHRIEPHQIVGLDYVHLVPVIRWLINRSAEVRLEHEAFNRLLALRHFARATNQKANWTLCDLGKQTRAQWTHLVHVDKVREMARAHLAALNKNSPKTESVNSSGVNDDGLERRWHKNPLMSFVKLPVVMRSNQANQRRTTGRPSEDSPEDQPEVYPDESFTSYSSPSHVVLGADSIAIDANLSEDERRRIINEELDTEILATNQKIFNLLRRMDTMPSELEIAQYQKRYIELHQQLISKNKDLKKLYALFNSLDSTRHYLSKEINLLDSISGNLHLLGESSTNREHFMLQLRDIIDKIQLVRSEVRVRLDKLRANRDELNEEYAKLMESNNSICTDEL